MTFDSMQNSESDQSKPALLLCVRKTKAYFLSQRYNSCAKFRERRDRCRNNFIYMDQKGFTLQEEEQ